jgi:phosphoribosylpyrophosphate synthetase
MHNLLHTLKSLDERAALCSCVGVVRGAQYSLLFHESARKFQSRLVRVPNNKFVTYETIWGHFPDGTDRIEVIGMKIDKKPDGFFSGHNIFFVASFHNNADTLSQFHFLHYLCSQQRPASITILLPFFCTGTMERIAPGEEGLVPTAATLASMFSSLPFQGGVRIMTYDVHVLAEKFFFHGNATLTTHTAIPLLLEKLGRDKIKCVVFPDEGAKKRFEKLFNPDKDGVPFKLLFCAKVHVGDGSGKKVKVEEGAELHGEKTIIVDDMTKSGNTLFKCKEAILEIGAGSVSVFVTHGAFTEEFWTLLEGDRDKKFEKIYTTDSVMDVEEKIRTKAGNDKELFEIISLASQVVKDL